MLSAPAEGIPKGDSWEYEPKWDGFRTLVFRDGDKVDLISRGGRSMTRYFPELVAPVRGLREQQEPKFVATDLDGQNFADRAG